MTINFWFNVDYCFTIYMSSDDLVYYLTFKLWSRPSTLFDRTSIIHMTTSVILFVC